MRELWRRTPNQPYVHLVLAWLLGVPLGLAAWGLMVGMARQDRAIPLLQHVVDAVLLALVAYVVSLPVVGVIAGLLWFALRRRWAGPAVALLVALLPAAIGAMTLGTASGFTQAALAVGLLSGGLYAAWAYRTPPIQTRGQTG